MFFINENNLGKNSRRIVLSITARVFKPSLVTNFKVRWQRESGLQNQGLSINHISFRETSYIKANEAPIPTPATIINEANIGDNLVSHQGKISTIRNA